MERAVFLWVGEEHGQIQEASGLETHPWGIEQQGLVMCQAGTGDPLTRWLLQNPFSGVEGVNQELLSIRQLVSVADKEDSGCNDAKARGPPSGHQV